MFSKDDEENPVPLHFGTYLDHRKRMGKWLMLPRDYLQIMVPGEACMVVHLLNIAKLGNSYGWVMANELFIERGLNYPPEVQHKYIERLCKLKILQVKYEGKTRVRMLRVNYDRIEQLIAQANPTAEGAA